MERGEQKKLTYLYKTFIIRNMMKAGYLSLLLILVLACKGKTTQSIKVIKDSYGAIVRGDVSQKKISLVFTGHEFAEGGKMIQEILKKKKIQASFFFTGYFYSNPSNSSLIKLLKKDGHYLGAHSDQHLLYNDWKNRDSLFISQSVFFKDLENNYKKMAYFGVKKSEASYFLPPYEWYNAKIVQWSREQGLQLINFSNGTRSNADYTYPEMTSQFISSEDIYKSIIEYESKDPNGLNGFILLLHLGTDPRRKDKFYFRLDELINEMSSKGYEFVRVDQLLNN